MRELSAPQLPLEYETPPSSRSRRTNSRILEPVQQQTYCLWSDAFPCGRDTQDEGSEGNEENDEPGLFIIGASEISSVTVSQRLSEIGRK